MLWRFFPVRDILLGMVSAVGLAAAGVYLYSHFKRNGLSF